MSGIATGKVFTLDLPRNKQLVLLAMADTADKHGRGTNPSTRTVAWKTDYSIRQAQRIINSLVADKILVVVSTPKGKPVVYDINFDAAPKKVLPFQNQNEGKPDVVSEPEGYDIQMTYDTQMSDVTFENEGYDIQMSQGYDIQMSPITVLNEKITVYTPEQPEGVTTPIVDALPESKKQRAKTNDDLLFDAIALHILQIKDGNYDGVASTIADYRKRLKRDFKNPPVTPEEIKRFSEWYRRTMRDSKTGELLNFPNPHKIGAFFAKYRKTNKPLSIGAESGESPEPLYQNPSWIKPLRGNAS